MDDILKCGLITNTLDAALTMAEPVEDDVSFLGTQETIGNNSPSCDSQVPSTEYHEAGTDYRVPEYRPAGALRAPVVPSQTKQERKHSSG